MRGEVKSDGTSRGEKTFGNDLLGRSLLLGEKEERTNNDSLRCWMQKGGRRRRFSHLVAFFLRLRLLLLIFIFTRLKKMRKRKDEDGRRNYSLPRAPLLFVCRRLRREELPLSSPRLRRFLPLIIHLFSFSASSAPSPSLALL